MVVIYPRSESEFILWSLVWRLFAIDRVQRFAQAEIQWIFCAQVVIKNSSTSCSCKILAAEVLISSFSYTLPLLVCRSTRSNLSLNLYIISLHRYALMVKRKEGDFSLLTRGSGKEVHSPPFSPDYLSLHSVPPAHILFQTDKTFIRSQQFVFNQVLSRCEWHITNDHHM